MTLLTSGPLKYTGALRDQQCRDRHRRDPDLDHREPLGVRRRRDHPRPPHASPASDRIYAHVESTPTGKPAFKAQDDGTSVAPGGGEVRSTVWYVGINIFNKPGHCFFGGYAII